MKAEAVQNVKVISVRQPWAWLIVNGWKNIENRTWPTNFRGRIMIHASKGMTREEYNACYLFVCGFAPDLAVSKMPSFDDMKQMCGGIVGETTIIACVTHHSSEWFCGPYGYVLVDSKPLPFEPMRGQLGIFDYRKAGAK